MTAWMARSGKPVTQITLARFGDIHPMQVSQVLKALEAKDMVARPRSPTDIRAKFIELTEAGVAALRQAMPLAIAVQAHLFGAAGASGGSLLKVLAGPHTQDSS